MNFNRHPFLIFSQSITEICKPLFEYTGVKTFDWIRTYEDGSRIRLTTDPRWVEHYLKQEYYNDSQLEKHPSFYRSGFTIWDYQAHRETKEVSLIRKDMSENFNRDHGLSILKVNSTYMDNYIFTVSPSQADINPSYFYYLESIERFIIYFTSKAAKFILEAQKQKIILPIKREKFLCRDGSALQNDAQFLNFIKETSIEKACINLSDRLHILGKNQTKCLVLSLKGKTSKEIARILTLSPRSVETYLDNIKSKLNFSSRAQMFEHILNEESILLLTREKNILGEV